MRRDGERNQERPPCSGFESACLAVPITTVCDLLLSALGPPYDQPGSVSALPMDCLR